MVIVAPVALFSKTTLGERPFGNPPRTDASSARVGPGWRFPFESTSGILSDVFGLALCPVMRAASAVASGFVSDWFIMIPFFICLTFYFKLYDVEIAPQELVVEVGEVVSVTRTRPDDLAGVVIEVHV